MKRSKSPALVPAVSSAVLTFLAVIALLGLIRTPAFAGFATVYNFTGSPTDGSDSYGSLVQDPITGNYYGTTISGGAHGLGAIFCMTPAYAVTIIHSFNSPGGVSPTCTLAIEPLTSGISVLFGTTLKGGTGGGGIVFRIKTNGTGYTVLHNFLGSPDGANPWAGVILAVDGLLHGTTLNGGSGGYGTTYELRPGGGAYVVTHSFLNYDGAHPYARLYGIPGTKLLAGTTAYGGATSTGLLNNDGVVFIEPLPGPGLVDIHAFAGTPDGAHPTAELISVGASGAVSLWGTTDDGGPSGSVGTIYSIEPSGASYQQEYAFTGGPADGAVPFGALVQSSITGDIYGTTVSGGANGLGSVYEAIPGGIPPIPETLRYSFTFADGWNPYAALYPGAGGTLLFSTTRDGGSLFDGTIFYQTP